MWLGRGLTYEQNNGDLVPDILKGEDADLYVVSLKGFETAWSCLFSVSICEPIGY